MKEWEVLSREWNHEHKENSKCSKRTMNVDVGIEEGKGFHKYDLDFHNEQVIY